MTLQQFLAGLQKQSKSHCRHSKVLYLYLHMEQHPEISSQREDSQRANQNEDEIGDNEFQRPIVSHLCWYSSDRVRASGLYPSDQNISLSNN